MRKTILGFFLITAAILFFSPPIQAYQMGGNSAELVLADNQPQPLILSQSMAAKKRAIQAVLKRYNSPMIDSVDSLLVACKKEDLNCYLLPAIAGLESTFGKQIMPGSYNPYGWANGRKVFESFDDANLFVAHELNQKYVARGYKTVEQIGTKYSASETWAARVSTMVGWFELEEEKNRLYFPELSVKL